MLQGSLDNFALDEVLGLLSSTAKTGRLELDGDRGVGSLTIKDGNLVDAQAAGYGDADGPEEVVFELLRYSTGSFFFSAVEVPADAVSRNVTEVLEAAETRLADWRTIEAVVPSVDHELAPVETLPADEVTIGRREWAALRAIGAGASVSLLCDALDLGEVEGSRQAKELVERGLLDIAEPRLTGDDSPVGVDEPGHDEAATGRSGRPELVPVDEPGFERAATDDSSGPGDDLTDGDDRDDDELGSGVFSAGMFGVAAAPHPTPTGLPAPSERDGRPPMPAAPTPEELIAGDAAGMFDRHSDGEAGGSDDDGQPGGLLMRYLKSDD